MKLTILCEKIGRNHWSCHGFLSNGFCIGEHTCSDPCYAPGDLWKGRIERQTAIAKIFNIAITDIEVIQLKSVDDIPVFIATVMPDDFKEEYVRYHELLDGVPESKITIEFAE